MKHSTTHFLSLAFLALALSACGGGDEPATAATAPAPAPAPALVPADPVATTTPAVALTSCTVADKTLTYSANKSATGNPFTDGQKVCFEASATSLAFNGKTLTNPVANTLVSAPYSAYKFTDGAYSLEVVLNAGALYEINVLDATTFFGQFAK
jgi:hypothetical protein